MAFVGCTLDEEVISYSQPSTYYQTVPQCRTGVNGCYIPLRSIYANITYFEVCEVATDIMYHPHTTSYHDLSCNYTPAVPRFGKTIWNNCYQGIMRCNAIIAAVERAPLTDDEKAPLIAESVILRAFYYYILTINFGDVPYYFDEVTDDNNDEISVLPRMDAKVLRTKLMDQLSYWLEDSSKEWVPEDDDYKARLAAYKQEQLELNGAEPVVKCRKALRYIKTYDPSNEYRIGSMVGFVIAGKLAMWNKRFDKAIQFYKYVEDVYGCLDNTGSYDPKQSLMDYPISDIMFRNRYTAESIFELPAYAKDYGLRVTNNLAMRCTPPRTSTLAEGDAGNADSSGEGSFEDELVDYSKKDDMYNGIRIPELGAEARTNEPYRPTNVFYQTLMPYRYKNPKDNNKYVTDKRCCVYDVANFSGSEINMIEGSCGTLAWCYSGWSKDENMDQVPRHMMWFSSVGKADARPYLGDKFWCPGMIYTQDSNNLKIFRFAHVILDLAEACYRVGNYTDAYGYLNASRLRAGIHEISQEDHSGEMAFMSDLQDESARELFGEFTRRHNLVRWGIWRERVLTYSNNATLKEYVQMYPCLEYYPIPDEQVLLSNGNLTNDKYTECGL